ncbi:hypothetical protein [Sinosporangium siamense]|uniref:Uncharacterized protein n=1 Tax=Sinosporangium siamense TaxID=1367973 RepID=A0A919V877_9ACTN|nr:hypothetical protein [Sinosporangium siamense]GII95865.1 hypothetical protein Ssi02_60960 [Sinosporangium siamense]
MNVRSLLGGVILALAVAALPAVVALPAVGALPAAPGADPPLVNVNAMFEPVTLLLFTS